MPGCHPENISAEIVENQFVVTGERSLLEGAVRRYRTERWQGRFVRSFVVPRGLDGDRIKADYNHGVLTIRLPKPEAAQPEADRDQPRPAGRPRRDEESRGDRYRHCRLATGIRAAAASRPPPVPDVKMGR